MRYFDKSILATLLSAVLLLTSCIYEEGDDATTNADATFVVLTLTMGGEQDGTRASTWGDTDYSTETATEWENTIEQGCLQILVYDLQNKYIGSVDYLVYSPSATNKKEYTVRGTLRDPNGNNFAYGSLECKLVVIANYDKKAAPAAGSLLSDISNLSYEYNYNGMAQQKSYIPMWGIATYGGTSTKAALDLQKNKETDAGEIDLLRSMAKIRVHLSTEQASETATTGTSAAENYTINSTTLSDYNSKGYIFPAGFDTIKETDELEYEGNSFHELSSKMNQELTFVDEYGFTQQVEQVERTGTTATGKSIKINNAGQSYILYVPEYDTDGSAATTTPSITVEISPKSDAETEYAFNINLRSYTAGEEGEGALQLIRNTVYDYEITRVTEKFILEYQALDWFGTAPKNISFE